jgi:hypothetical protein
MTGILWKRKSEQFKTQKGSPYEDGGGNLNQGTLMIPSNC